LQKKGFTLEEENIQEKLLLRKLFWGWRTPVWSL